MPFQTILLTSTKWLTWVPAVNEMSKISCSHVMPATNEHITNNEAVRKTLLERGIRPESLPAAEDVKKVERRLSSEEKKSLKNPDALDA